MAYPTVHVPYQNITIETVDGAVVDWFDQTVNAHVSTPNGERKKVPVIFASGERAITSRQRKGIRDQNGLLILPLISVRRTSVEPTPNMKSLGVETPNFQIARRLSPKTNTLQNNNKVAVPALRKKEIAPVYEITTIPFPDSSVMNYELVIQTQYIIQMNAILEKIFHELDMQKSFVAPFENNHRHPPIGEEFEDRPALRTNYVVGFLDNSWNDGGNFEEFTDQERIVRYSTSIRVPAVLQLDPEGEKPSIQIKRTSTEISFPDEQVITPQSEEEWDLFFPIPGKR